MGNERKMVDSGVEWIEDVPEGWALVRCGELFSQRTEKGKNTERMLTCSIQSGVVPQEKYEELTGRKLSKPVNNKENYNKTYKGDLVYNKMRMWQGAVGLSDYNGVVSPAYVVLVCSDKQNSRYSYWQFVSECFIEQSNSNSKGICDDQNSLSFNRFSQMTMLLPPLPEQQAIATFLDHHVGLIDRERELIDQKIGLLKDKRKALIFECVTGKRTIVEAQHLAGVDDWTDIVGSGPLVAVPTAGKDDPFVKGGRLVDSGVDWIGEVPEGWGTQKIKDIAKVKKGTQIDFGPDDHPGFFPYQNGGISPSFYSSRQNTPENTIAISEGGASAGHVQLMHTPFWCGGHCYAVSGTEKAPTRHLYWMLKAAETQLKENKTGTAMPNLKSGELLNLSVPMPSNPTQTLISDFLDHQTTLIDQEIDLLETKSSLLADKRKALIFEAVTGKIDCTQP
jgi:type I restriction enzyme S subunit